LAGLGILKVGKIDVRRVSQREPSRLHLYFNPRETGMKIHRVVLAAIMCTALASTIASAACPVGKKEGDTWCANGYKWKCEKCGSEYCEIMQPGSCLKDDDRLDVTGISRPLKRVSAAPRDVPAYSARR
jgi:hypothetical protein